MKSFEPGFLENHPISHSLLQTIRLLGEFKGKEALFTLQAPQVLETLRQVAVIPSTESSNRIEGVEAPHDRIRKIVEQKTTPRNRSEQEIAGYRDVLATIHANHANIPFTPGVVLQFHRDMYQFAPQEGGRWKPVDNQIIQRDPGGGERVRFIPVAAYETARAMEQLHERFGLAREAGKIEPLLLIAAYVLDFLCIHPFFDGNGRMARLLSLLQLYQTGYEVGRYISLEQVVENNREGYYDSLHASSQGWHEGRHSLEPWWEYFLGVMLVGAYREFERRTGELTTARGAKSEMVLATIEKLPRQFRYTDLDMACPNISRATIKRILKMLRDDNKLRCVKGGRNATYEKIGS